MASISCNEIAQELAGFCLRREVWPRRLLHTLLEHECSDALFRIVVEGLADRFEPALCEIYAELFCEALAYILPGTNAKELLARYHRVRQPRKFEGDAGRIRNVFVLSRVTLGADVAITSVILDGMKRRFPESQIFLAGGRKNWELFGSDPRIHELPIPYRRRGTLRERLAPWFELQRLLGKSHSLVIDPDSRLTQLGLLPVCPEEDYYFFESRSYGGDSEDALPCLTQRWLSEVFGVEGAPYVAPLAVEGPSHRPVVSLSLGVGENPAKRVADPFEEQLLQSLAARNAFLCIDKGAGGEESERVERAISRAGVPAERLWTWSGSFAGFASIIGRSELYIGYDSAGQHVAAACGIPLLSVFAGFPSPRMFARWRPSGSGRIEVVRVDQPVPGQVLGHTLRALERLWK